MLLKFAFLLRGYIENLPRFRSWICICFVFFSFDLLKTNIKGKYEVMELDVQWYFICINFAAIDSHGTTSTRIERWLTSSKFILIPKRDQYHWILLLLREEMQPSSYDLNLPMSSDMTSSDLWGPSHPVGRVSFLICIYLSYHKAVASRRTV